MEKTKISKPIKNIVIPYFLFGVLWIIFSDTAAVLLIDDLEFYQRFQSVKGIVFVIVTGMFLYYLLKTNLKKLEAKEEKLYQQAYFDSLSSLRNKRSLYKDLSQKFKKDDRTAAVNNFALFYINIKNIDNLTEIKGHTHSSDLIKKVARKFENNMCQQNDCNIYNYNYDKFILVMENIKNDKELEKKAGYILNLAEEMWNQEEINYYINLEIGIAKYPDSGRDPETLISSAQLASSKIDSEDKHFKIYKHQFFLEKLEKENLKRDLRTAIKKKQFELYYQPKVQASDKSISNFEALIRWEHPVIGMISPYKFIKIAEETGLIREIGDWVIEEAFRQLFEWQEKYNKDLGISVNLSPIELYDKNIINKIEAIYKKHPIRRESMEFEITESVLLDNRGNPIEIINQLREMGFSIALDDFGIGYSSFSYLSRLAIDTLKIDKSFVDKLSEEKNMLLIDSIIKLSHKMKLKVVAEGIENSEQFKKMKDLNCDEIQGYYFYKAMRAEKIEELLKNKKS